MCLYRSGVEVKTGNAEPQKPPILSDCENLKTQLNNIIHCYSLYIGYR